MKVDSREYKLLVQHAPFVHPLNAVEAVWNEIERALRRLPTVRTSGELDERETRRIVFLDTPDHTLRRNGLVLRQRAAGEALEYTLKCRSEDRYFAAGTDVGAADRLGEERKLEEDIAPPFRCRLSHSSTISLEGKRRNGPRDTPRMLREATELFPVLGTIREGGRRCRPGTALEIVSGITVEESVWKGGRLVFSRDGHAKSEKASMALILWTTGEAGRPVIAELSFRITESEKPFTRSLAEAARSAYTLLQRLDCARRGGMTKTAYIYRDATQD